MRSRFPLLVALFLLALALSGCGRGAKPAGLSPVPVRVAQAETRDLPVTVDAVGTVESYNSVRVYARISGQVLRRHFKEGEDVREGALLFTIDPAPFQEKLNAAEAALAHDQALLEYTRSEARRYEGLLTSGAVSKSEAEKATNDEKVLLEQIRVDKAQAEQARLDLGYCAIRSPIAGRTGAYLANEGTFVEAYKTDLVVVNQIRPIYVAFSIPESQLPAVKEQAARETLRVKVTLPGSGTACDDGALTFIDNAVDAQTGMIQLKGEFPNAAGLLWPGQFADASIVLSTLKGAVVVPSAAVLATPKGRQVFVVGPEQKAELREVQTGGEHEGFTAILKGISAGDTVVVEGMNKLKNGFAVKAAEP